MSNVLHSNGRPPRKTLAMQLDRLDAIIDTLGDGLNEAVAGVVRHAVTVAVQQAVETVMREVMSRPELLRSLQGQVTSPSPAEAVPAATSEGKPSKLKAIGAVIKTQVGTAWNWLCGIVIAAGQWIGQKTRALPGKLRNGLSITCEDLKSKARGCGRGVRETARKAWRLRRPVLLSLVIGLAVGGMGYLAGPVLSALALGGCGSAMSLGAILMAPFVRLWRSLHGEVG